MRGSMKIFPATIIIALQFTGLLYGKPDSTALEPAQNLIISQEDIGFLVVECDSVGLDIYVDNMLVGQSPIDSPVPLPTGDHIVTYLHPQFLDLLKQYYHEREVKQIVSRSMQTVYITPGQTVSVNLWWRPYESHLKVRKRWIWLKSFVGAVMVGTLLALNIP